MTARARDVEERSTKAQMRQGPSSQNDNILIEIACVLDVLALFSCALCAILYHTKRFRRETSLGAHTILMHECLLWAGIRLLLEVNPAAPNEAP